MSNKVPVVPNGTSSAEQLTPRLSPGAFYAERLLTLLYPKGRPPRPTMCRDVTILKRMLAHDTPDNVAMVVREVRRQAEYGRLAPWIRPGEDITLRALNFQGGGAWNYERFKHEALKRTAHKRTGTSQTVADIFAAIAAKGRAG